MIQGGIMIELPFNFFLKVNIRPDGSGDWIPVWMIQLPDSEVAQLEGDDGVAIVCNIQPQSVNFDGEYVYFETQTWRAKWQARKAIKV
jgi:hypothetical protein